MSARLIATMDIPDELATALDASPEARAVFDALSPSHQREYASHVADAVNSETRVRRAERMVELLLTDRPTW